MTFKEWIKRYEGKDTPLGDLAADVRRDAKFPENGGYEDIYRHLENVANRNIRHKVLRIFREAWAAYAKQGYVRLPSEAEIEHKFCKKIEQLGGIAVKFTPPGWSGAPDRIVLLPGGVIKFVEFKVLGAEPRALQKLRLVQLRNLGFESYVIDSMRDVDAFIEMIKYEIDDDVDSRFEKLDYDAIESVFRV